MNHFDVPFSSQMERALFAEQYAQATRDSMRRFGGRQWNELLATVQVQYQLHISAIGR